MIEPIVKYKVEKSKESDKYILVRYAETERGGSIGKVFEGTYKECYEEKRKKENDNGNKKRK